MNLEQMRKAHADKKRDLDRFAKTIQKAMGSKTFPILEFTYDGWAANPHARAWRADVDTLIRTMLGLPPAEHDHEDYGDWTITTVGSYAHGGVDFVVLSIWHDQLPKLRGRVSLLWEELSPRRAASQVVAVIRGLEQREMYVEFIRSFEAQPEG